MEDIWGLSTDMLQFGVSELGSGKECAALVET